MPKPTINKGKCNKCVDQESEICIGSCPVGVFAKKGKDIVVKDPEACIGCRACEAQCPREAVIVKDDDN